MLLLLVCLTGLQNFISAHDSCCIKDNDFVFGDEPSKYAIYRLVGNDMPPLQTRGQLRWNTRYALENEPNFPGVHKRWIINRIFNETEFKMLYSDLVSQGVLRRDIIARCLDLSEYNSYKTLEDKMFYLTSQNEGRNAGIIDGRDSGFEWSIILDGNTFITADSWDVIETALEEASSKKMSYMKIPYHRVHSEQNTSWLNKETVMKSILQFAPTKGESQIAFHRHAKEMFTLGDTKPENKDKGKPSKGYGQRNKSYMFKEGQICGPDSKVCKCADVIEGNEEVLKDMKKSELGSYTKSCGMVLRLWNYPTQEVIDTGLHGHDEEGFFCYFKFIHDSISDKGNECDRINKAAMMWKELSENERKRFRGSKSESCKEEYHNIFLTESCFRSTDREIAMKATGDALDDMIKQKFNTKNSLCANLRPPPNDPRRQHYLTVFDEETLTQEKKAWNNRGSTFSNAIDPLLQDLIAKADKSLKLSSFSVTQKKRTPKDTNDKKYYFSPRPFHWSQDDLPSDVQKKVKNGDERLDKNGLLYRDGVSAPGSLVGGPGQELYDRSTAVYTISNITTLALAWFFTEESKYAKKGADLVDAFFLDDKTGMYPDLDYAHGGEKLGMLEWKDIYYLLDAVTLLEKSAALSSKQVLAMQKWCAQLSRWLMRSTQGHQMGLSFNHHGLYFDIMTLSTSLYAKDDDLVDVARRRLYFRLSKEAPDGHFDKDGAQPHEINKPTALHLVTVNVAGWIHAALINEAARDHSELPGSFRSLWWVKHESDSRKGKGLPVLLKAIRWLTQFLPSDPKLYKSWQKPSKGMAVNFPYPQTEDFAFDRLLEIVHYGVQVYGVKLVFPDKPTSSVTTALNFPLYTMQVAMHNDFSTVHEDSGTRAWPSLGLYANRSEEVRR